MHLLNNVPMDYALHKLYDGFQERNVGDVIEVIYMSSVHTKNLPKKKKERTFNLSNLLVYTN